MSLRFLLDENVPVDLGFALSARGHDVLTLPPHLRSAADHTVLALAAEQDRVLVTLDTDFGALVFLFGQTPPPAVVLIRLTPPELARQIGSVVRAIELALDDSGLFVVIDSNGVRVRPLP